MSAQQYFLVGLPDRPLALDVRRRHVDDRPPNLRRTVGAGLRRHRLAVVIAVQLLCIAGVVTLSRLVLVHESLRLDESQSLQQTDRSYDAMLGQVAQEAHVPAYHLLLRTWRLMFGMDAVTARTLSMIFFVAAVPVFYLVARRLLRTRFALLAVALFCASPFMNWFANETRMYAMLVLVTLLSQLAFMHLLRGGDVGAWGGYALSAVAGAYTHYFFVSVLLAQGVFYVVTRPRERWVGLGRMLLTAAMVMVALTPWLVYFRDSGAGAGTRPNLPTPSSVDFTNVYSNFLFGFQGDAVNSVLVATWPLLVLAALMAVRVAGKPRRETAYLVVAAVCPVALAFAASHVVTPFFLSRYMIAALPAVLLLVVAFISALSPRVAALLSVVLLAVTVSATAVEVTSRAVPVKEDYRTAAQLLSAKATPRDVVVLSSPFTIWPFEQYYDGSAMVTTLPGWDRSKDGGIPAFDEQALPQEADALADGHQRVYLLLSYDQGYEDTVYQYFQHTFEQIYSDDLTPGMRIVGYRVGYSQQTPVDALQLGLTSDVG